jgi:hypothetical protein
VTGKCQQAPTVSHHQILSCRLRLQLITSTSSPTTIPPCSASFSRSFDFSLHSSHSCRRCVVQRHFLYSARPLVHLRQPTRPASSTRVAFGRALVSSSKIKPGCSASDLYHLLLIVTSKRPSCLGSGVWSGRLPCPRRFTGSDQRALGMFKPLRTLVSDDGFLCSIISCASNDEFW